KLVTAADTTAVAAAGAFEPVAGQLDTGTPFLPSSPRPAGRGLVGAFESRARTDAMKRWRHDWQARVCAGESRPVLARLCDSLAALPPETSVSAAAASMKEAALRDLERLPEVALQRSGASSDRRKSVVLFALVMGRALREGRAPLDILANAQSIVCAPQS